MTTRVKESEESKGSRRGAIQPETHLTAEAHTRHAARGRAGHGMEQRNQGRTRATTSTETLSVPTRHAPSTPTKEEGDRKRELPCEMKGSIFLPTSSSRPTRLSRLLSPVEGHSHPRPQHAQQCADARRPRTLAGSPLRALARPPCAPLPSLPWPSPGPLPALSYPSPGPLLSLSRPLMKPVAPRTPARRPTCSWSRTDD